MRLRAEREAYAAANQDMLFDQSALTDAADHLDEANRMLHLADQEADNISYGFHEEEQQGEGEESFLQWIWKGICSIADSIAQLGKQLSAMGADLLWLRELPLLKKGARAGRTLAEYGNRLMADVEGGALDAMFEVTLTTLPTFAKACQEQADIAKQQITAAMDAITTLGNSWKGDDYDSLKSAANQAFEQIGKNADVLKESFEYLNTAHNKYKAFQDKCMEEWQAARN